MATIPPPPVAELQDFIENVNDVWDSDAVAREWLTVFIAALAEAQHTCIKCGARPAANRLGFCDPCAIRHLED